MLAAETVEDLAATAETKAGREAAQAYLDSHDEGLAVTVALDSEGSVSEQYMADAIPQTVIIGKDGTVQAVHVGVSSRLEDTLRAELQTLVDGEALTD